MDVIRCLVLVAVIVTGSMVFGGTSFAHGTYGETMYVGGSGAGNYTTIQDALNDSLPGDRIVVFSGFYGRVNVNKSVSLEGRNAFTGAVLISASNSTFSGFVVKDCYRAIVVEGNDNTVANCTVLNSSYGMKVYGDGNTVSSNRVFKNLNYGIWVENGKGNSISGNGVYRNNYGIYIDGADGNTVDGNVVSNNTEGIKIQGGKDNIVSGNSIADNRNDGIYMCCDSEGNIIFGNNFVGNRMNAKCYSRDNLWDHHREGNYWDDYDGSGPYGIVYGDNEDRYPSPSPYSVGIRPGRMYIICPESGSNVSGTLNVNGIAEDGAAVEVRVDSGSWKEADGTFLWNFDMDTGKMGNGEHHVYARCGNASVEITIYVSNEGKTPSFGAIMFLGAFSFALILTGKKKSQEKNI